MVIVNGAQCQLRYIEWKGVKIYDFQKVTFSTIFKLYIAGLGVIGTLQNISALIWVKLIFNFIN